jgi:hypothetical protein
MLDENAKRKPNFDERNSTPVILADGQSWYVPKPWFEVRPRFRRGRAVAYGLVPTSGAALDDLIEAIADTDDWIEQVVAVASLAAHLLGFNYDLSDRDLDQLLAYRAADPSSAKWVRDVIGVATGANGPKVYSAGSD